MIEIRPATPDDLAPLAALVAAFRSEHSRLIGGATTVAAAAVADEVTRRLASPDAGYLVALGERPTTVLRDGLAGVGVVSRDLVGYRQWERHDGFLFGRELYVVPHARRQRVARLLVTHFEEWLRASGQDIACITCVPQNAAMITLARSMGYEFLNTIELRKPLLPDARAPRSEVDALGHRWKIL